MSLITRCPACGTMFKVVTDQLKISQGWVRCGHCAEVFDAAAHLQPYTPPAADEAPADVPSGLLRASADAAAAEVGAPRHPVRSDDALPSAEEELRGYQREDRAEDQPEDLQDDAVVSHPIPLMAEHEVLRPHSAGSSGDEPAATQDQDQPDTVSLLDPEDIKARQAVRWEFPSSQVEAEQDPPPLAPPDVSFVRHARRKAFWGRPRTRFVLALLGLLLSLALVLQIALQQRDRLAVSHPGLEPLLASLCVALGCEIRPLQDIDALIIDSSSFAKLSAGSYRLGFAVKNVAALPVAMPALELTLTDTRDQPVVRRVFRPAELGATQELLAAGGEFTGAITLDVRDGAQATQGAAGSSPAPTDGAADAAGLSQRIAGYRLLAFILEILNLNA